MKMTDITIALIIKTNDKGNKNTSLLNIVTQIRISYTSDKN